MRSRRGILTHIYTEQTPLFRSKGLNTKPLLGTFQIMGRNANGIKSPSHEVEETTVLGSETSSILSGRTQFKFSQPNLTSHKWNPRRYRINETGSFTHLDRCQHDINWISDLASDVSRHERYTVLYSNRLHKYVVMHSWLNKRFEFVQHHIVCRIWLTIPDGFGFFYSVGYTRGS